MAGQPTQTESRDWGKLIMTLMVAAIVVSVGAISFAMYSKAQASKGTNPPIIKTGDTVMMNYIGRFADGRVFDTSIASVGQNNALYPKSLTWAAKANTSYVPFNMTAGNYGSGGTIKGFAMGVIGLSEGDHAIIDVPADEAYPINADYVHTVNIVDNVSILQSMTDTDFTLAFGAPAIVGQVYQHYFWGWNIMVVSDAAGLVIYRNDPVVRQVVYPFGNPMNISGPSGWPEVNASAVYNIKGTDSDGATFVVSSFNATAGTFQITKNNSSSGFNGEIAGRELFFEVFILKVTSP
jgi:FKBP-type peptidyl-prolyl cis-trans isomerase 2